ncbi:hypothetical protein ACGYLM_07350 [Sulfitobacter sp. 1A10445]
MRQRLGRWLQIQAAPDRRQNVFWIGALYVAWIGSVWYFRWGIHLW